MNTNIWGKRFLAILGSTLIGLMLATGTYAANPEPVTVEVEFVAAINITETNALQFGLLDDAMADTETIIIAPDGGTTDAGANWVGGNPLAQATFNVTAANAKAITILVDGVNTPALSGYALGTWMCNYDRAGGGSDGVCDGAGLSETSGSGIKELQIGVTLTHDAVAATGIKNSTFNLTITYN